MKSARYWYKKAMISKLQGFFMPASSVLIKGNWQKKSLKPYHARARQAWVKSQIKIVPTAWLIKRIMFNISLFLSTCGRQDRVKSNSNANHAPVSLYINCLFSNLRITLFDLFYFHDKAISVTVLWNLACMCREIAIWLYPSTVTLEIFALSERRERLNVLVNFEQWRFFSLD